MDYEEKIRRQLRNWQAEMQREPTALNRLSKRMQDRVNSWIPERVHHVITLTIKQMIRLVLFGAGLTTGKPMQNLSLEKREGLVQDRIKFFRTASAAEGAITGAGGILAGLADFPLLLGLKIKLLFEIASLYGYDTKNYTERVYLLYIFQLAFSSHEHRRNIYEKMTGWDSRSADMPLDINAFDWRKLQEEYRDYIDIAKMAQLIPLIGAPVGAVANYQLIRKLGRTCMNAYRMRWLDAHSISGGA